jgi:hypothetical protein
LAKFDATERFSSTYAQMGRGEDVFDPSFFKGGYLVVLPVHPREIGTLTMCPEDLRGLLIIDYLFHLPSMAAALVLGYCFFSLLRKRSETRASAR